MDRNTLKILKKTHLFNNMEDEYVEGIEYIEKSFGRNEIVLNEEDSIDSIYILKEGKAVAEKIYEEGESDLIAVFEPGDIAALEVLFSTFRSMPYALFSDQPSVFIIIPLKKLTDNENRVIILENMVRLLADKNIRDMYKLEALSKHGLRERIMTHLKIMRQKKGTDIFDISMTQQQLAQYLCVNRSALSFELNNMKRDGLINFNRSRFQILK